MCLHPTYKKCKVGCDLKFCLSVESINLLQASGWAELTVSPIQFALTEAIGNAIIVKGKVVPVLN